LNKKMSSLDNKKFGMIAFLGVIGFITLVVLEVYLLMKYL